MKGPPSNDVAEAKKGPENMQVEIQLRDLLRRYGIKAHGARTEIADFLSVKRQTVSKLFNNRVDLLRVDHLGKLCEWLLKQVEDRPHAWRRLRNELPGCLFRLAGLWERLLESEVFTTVLGEKVLAPTQRSVETLFPQRWLSSTDAETAAGVIQALSKEESTAQFISRHTAFHLPENSAGQGSDEYKKLTKADKKQAIEQFAEFGASGDLTRRTHFLVGSQRVHLMVEVFVADLFGTLPFVANKSSPVPVHMRYRKDDKEILSSCFGGNRPFPKRTGKDVPGIYYQNAEKNWETLPWVKDHSTAGVVIVAEQDGRLDLALFGFCGRGTQLLGQKLVEDPDSFWPPTITQDGREIGVFACGMNYGDDDGVKWEIHRLHNSVLEASLP